MIDKAYTKFDTFKKCWNLKASFEKGEAIEANPGVAKLTRIFQALLPVILVGIAVITLAQFHGAWKWTLTDASNAAQCVRFGTLPLVVLVMIAIGAGTYENHRRSLDVYKNKNTINHNVCNEEIPTKNIQSAQLLQMSQIGEDIKLLIDRDFQAFNKNCQHVFDKSLVEKFEELVNRGMKINSKFINHGMIVVNGSGQTLIQYLTSLEVNDRYIKLIDSLEQCAVKNRVALRLSDEDSYGNTPLIWAIAQGSHATVDKLLAMSEKYKWSLNLDHCSANKLTPQNSALILLVAKGYNLNTSGVNSWKVGENTACALAQRILQLGANPNLMNTFGYRAMDYAVARADQGMIQILLDSQAKYEEGNFEVILKKLSCAEHDDGSIKMMLVQATSFHNNTAWQACFECPLFNMATFLDERNAAEVKKIFNFQPVVILKK